MTQPTIAISTNRPNLVVGVAASLEAKGLSVRLARGSRKDDFQVTYKPGVSLEQTVLAMNEASLQFQALVQTRNKLVQSYDTIMNMQV